MANRKIMLPQYGTVMKRGVLYYRTRIKDANGKLVAIYAKTPEELYNKETLALEQIENATFHRKTPTVAEYCEKWLLMQSVHVRATTLTDYTSKVRRHIIAELGDKRMGEVSLDDIQLALVPVSKKSASVYKSVVILYKSIFRAAMESRIIDHNPTIYLTTKGGGVPQEERQALTDEQVERLLDAIRDLPPYVFVMIGLYAGLRREEILALQWDSVYLDESILTKDFLSKIGLEGLVIGAMTMISFLTGYNQNGTLLGSTYAFGTLCLARLFHGYNCKSDHPVIFTKGLFHNKWLQGAFVLGAVLITTVLTVPGFHNLFKVETLNLMQLGCVYLYAFASLLIIQLLKCIRMKLRKRGER